MMRRAFVPAFVVLMSLAAGRADALTVRDVIELSKAGLSDSVLLALIDVDRTVFSIDTATLSHGLETVSRWVGAVPLAARVPIGKCLAARVPSMSIR